MLRAVVLGVMGLLVALVGLAVVVSVQPPRSAAAPAERTVSVLVAAGPVRAGTLLQPADLTARDLIASTLPEGASIDSADSRRALVGAMVRRSLDIGSPVIAGDVLRPGDRGFLAAVLTPGTRAVSVAVDAVSGAAGLIWPGDRVDVLLTQTIEGPEQAQAHRVSGEVVLPDVRVIAVDQQLVQGGQAAGMLDGSKSQMARTITLEVSPQDAARTAVAERLGKLQAVLRGIDVVPPAMATGALAVMAATSAGPPRPVASSSPPAPIWGGDVSAALRHDNGGGATVAVRLFEGAKQVEEYKF